MVDSSTESGKLIEYLVARKVDVCVCSCSSSETLAGLIRQIKDDMSDVVANVRFETLPYNIIDMDTFDFNGIDVLLLCHSIENRRFSLTNVTDALYDGFLPKARKYVGMSKVGVIAYDFSKEMLTEENLTYQMESFRNNQETTFRNSSVVLIGGQLNQVPIELNQDQLNELKTFFRFATSPLAEEKAEVCLRRRGCIGCLPCFLCCMKICPCCKPRRNVGCFAYRERDDTPPYTLSPGPV
nr:uncharacterized protein LOC129258067 [Lytechinus pictus]